MKAGPESVFWLERYERASRGTVELSRAREGFRGVTISRV
jgi:hypothetical protein